MRIILLGPPGSGKGTQAKLLSHNLGMVHISTGAILRQAIRQQTPEGKLAEPYVTQGRLVPDDVVNQMVAALFRSTDRPTDFLLDGYPRTIDQARTLDGVLREQGLPLDAVLFLDVDDEEILKRLSAGRWDCPNPACGATYNTINKQPRVPGVCDECGSALLQRDDDRESTVRQRLKIFHQVNGALLDHYQHQGLLLRVRGQGKIEDIYDNLARQLKPKQRK
ncbi:MAG: adenylate kinase [Gemmataceae bacterium]